MEISLQLLQMIDIKRRLTVFLLIFIMGMAYSSASAQSMPQNLTNINVDELTDNQIRQLIQQGQTTGLTDSQLLQSAQSRGMSANQIDKLQTRIADIRRKDANSGSIDNTNRQSNRQLNYKVDSDSVFVNHTKKDSIKNKLPIFGANLFRNSNIKFEPDLNLATPVNYILGPRDQLNISVYGYSIVNWKLDVSPEGNINIPGIGILNVAGKSIEQATGAIKRKLAAKNYAIGKGTNVQVTLGDIRSIKVIMIGELVRPGTYTLPSLATAFNALYSAGGPNDNGSFRLIEVIRNNKIIQRLDMYDFLTKGDQKSNIGLQDQDIIRVPSYRTTVELTGEVKNQAIFEVLPGETLQNIIDFAGGFTNQAYTARIKVSQISDQQRRITDVMEADFKNYIPLTGDRYRVYKVLDRYENRVTINGAVFRPGEYELQKGMTLSQLIEKAAGLREDAFMDRGSITRLKADNTTESISFNVKSVINKEIAIPLQREDMVNISSIFDLRDKFNVRISGDIRKPGTYAYADSMKVEDLIVLAGGFAEGASTKRLKVGRRIDGPESESNTIADVFTIDIDKQLKPGQANFTLKPFDIVSVYSLPGYQVQRIVKIEGEVMYPGSYILQQKDEKISDVIKLAGGLNTVADADGSTLKRNNIALMGIDKDKADTAAAQQEHLQRLNQVKQTFRDTLNTTEEYRNNFIGIELRQILDKPGSSTDLILEDGDVLRVPKKQQVVKVNGEVHYQSAVIYDRKKGFREYILNAGGYSSEALKRGAYIVYSNGTVKGTSNFLFFRNYPEVRPGSEIYVPKKPVTHALSAAEAVGLTSGLASLGAIILGILTLRK